MRLVNWTDQLAIHQSALMRGLVELGWSATMVVAEPVSEDRRAMGWAPADFGGVNIVINPSRSEVDGILQENPENTIHAFGSAMGYPWGRYALYRAARLKCRMGFMMEAGDPDGWKGPLRWVKYSAIRTLFGARIQFVLAMGGLGVRWFQKCGHPMEKLLPFGYFVERFNPIDASHLEHTGRSFRILFVGQLIPRKRVDLLIRALGMLPYGSAQLTIVGNGAERARLEKLAEQSRVAQSITWLGSLPNHQARELMADADLLVLPSRYDGWGAVVNEALMAGTPVICTDHCGAADLLGEAWRGEVVPRNDVKALAVAIRRRIEKGPVNQALRERISTWAECLSGESAARYMIAVFDHVYAGRERPVPPWYSS